MNRIFDYPRSRTLHTVSSHRILPHALFQPLSTLSAIKRGVRATTIDNHANRVTQERSKRPSIDTIKSPGRRRLAEVQQSRNEALRSSVPELAKRSVPRSRLTRSTFTASSKISLKNTERLPKSHDTGRISNQRRQTKQGFADPATQQTSLLWHIKSACRSVQSIRECESHGEDASSMINAARSSLSIVNQYVDSGRFRDDPGEAVASLFSKKAPSGIFVNGRPRDESRTVIFQGQDQMFDLFIGQGGVHPPHRSRQIDAQGRPSHTEEVSGGHMDRDFRSNPRQRTSHRNAKEARNNTGRQERSDQHEIPVSIPYTTAASEFLYGYNAVLAALKGGRRKLYHLYIHPKILEREFLPERGGGSYDQHISSNRPGYELVALAKAAKLPFHNEFNTRLLDKMSGGRPHNGVVLEASKLPAPPITSLGKPNLRRSVIPLNIGVQTAEETAVNGKPAVTKAAAGTWRYPLVVLLDGILDPGNLGNIIRTCHFYGVDAVAVATTTCADLSVGVVAKASSGACEATQLLAVKQPSNFVFESAKAQWKIYAAVAPVEGMGAAIKHVSTSELAKDSPLANHPCILMLGSEGSGLRENLKRRADRFVSISKGNRPGDSPDVGLDSLNVTVATGVLLESLLTKPALAPEQIDTSSELGF